MNRNRYKNEPYWVFLSAMVICLAFNWSYPIYILDEAKNSEAAREMWNTGNYIVPFFNGELRGDKPPFHYFMMALGYSIFGVNPLGARFFSGIFGAFTILITYLVTRKYLGIREARLTFIVLISALFFTQEFHLAVPDPYLIFFVSAGLFAFHEFDRSRSWPWLVAMYASFALGVLTKGPVALGIPGLVGLLYLGSTSQLRLRYILGLRPLLGLLILAGIALPWYLSVHRATDGEWTRIFFLDHNLSRFGSEMEGHGGIFLITPLFVFLGLLPFSVFAIQAFRWTFRNRKNHTLLLLSFLMAAVTIVFFSISSTKLPNYTMPSYPFIGIVLGGYLSQVLKTGTTHYFRASLWVLILISAALPIAGYFALLQEDIRPGDEWVAGTIAILLPGALWALYEHRKKRYYQMILSLAVSWIGMGFLLHGLAYPRLTASNPVKASEVYIHREANLVAFRYFNSAFPIHYERTIFTYDSVPFLVDHLRRDPSTLVISSSGSRKMLDSIDGLELLMDKKALFESHYTRVYRVVDPALESRRIFARDTVVRDSVRY